MNENKQYNNQELKEISEFWDGMNVNHDDTIRFSWWDSPRIIRHINENICGEAISGYNAGCIKVCREMFPNVPFKKGLSIGCGPAFKELDLVKQGIVESFDLFELSKKALSGAYKNFKQHGLEDRAHFYHGDIFTNPQERKYDFVFWSGSLHHMYDSEQAIITTYNMLSEGGCFFVEDFVGNNRFQWTAEQMKYVNEFRCSLPDIYFTNTRLQLQYHKRISPPDIDYMIKMDPSEAKDSEAIIPALEKHLNLKFLKLTGGVIYHIALGGILEQIPENSPILTTALKIDDKLTARGLNNYAFALGVK